MDRRVVYCHGTIMQYDLVNQNKEATVSHQYGWVLAVELKKKVLEDYIEHDTHFFYV